MQCRAQEYTPAYTYCRAGVGASLAWCELMCCVVLCSACTRAARARIRPGAARRAARLCMQTTRTYRCD
eukprot:10642595-Lingulodinium_polyedra.AAC.1